MAKTNPPDDWSVSTGTWTTDFDENTSVLLYGAQSIEFKNTTAGIDPLLISTTYYPVEPGGTYSFKGWMRATAIAAADHMRLGYAQYDNTKSIIGANTFWFDTELDAINTWQDEGSIVTLGATTRFLRLLMGKDDTNSFTGYFGYYGFKKHNVFFRAYQLAGATSIAASSWTEIDYDSEVNDYGGNFAANQFTAPVDGIYHLSASVVFSNTIADGKQVGISIGFVGGAAVAISYQHTGVANTQIAPNTNVTIALTKGQVLNARGWQNDAAAKNTATGSGTMFCGYLLREI